MKEGVRKERTSDSEDQTNLMHKKATLNVMLCYA